MSKFLVLYLSEVTAEEQMANATPEQLQKGMEPWMAWFGKMGSAIVDGGGPLGNGANVTKDGVGPRQTKVSGYTIIEAADLNTAKGMVAVHPHFMLSGSSVEVLEAMAMPGI